MDLRQLRTFQAVAELGSVSRAADRLRIAQPALSRQIKMLEHELRAELFVRDGRGMQLTAAGQHLLERTGGLLRQIEQVRDDLRSFTGVPTGRVAIGLVPTVSRVLSARIARAVIERLPGVSLRLLESYSGHLVEWLHKGEVDLAVLYAPSEELHVEAEPLGRDRLVAVGAKGAGLAGQRSVPLSWLAERPLALPSRSHGLRAIIERAAEAKGLPVEVAIEADSFRVLTEIVELGLGFAVLPLSAIRPEIAQARLETAPIVDPPLTRQLITARPIGSRPSVATTAIAEILREETRAAVAEGTWDLELQVG
jgi:DNA-binding transcriptional LysR family regulator